MTRITKQPVLTEMENIKCMHIFVLDKRVLRIFPVRKIIITFIFCLL